MAGRSLTTFRNDSCHAHVRQLPASTSSSLPAGVPPRWVRTIPQSSRPAHAAVVAPTAAEAEDIAERVELSIDETTAVEKLYTAQLLAFRATYDLTSRFDIGLNTSALFSGGGRGLQYAIGPEIGFTIHRNLRLGLGYNFTGFHDRDLVAFGLEIKAQTLGQMLLILHDQYAAHLAIGNCNVNRLPLPGPPLSAHARPPCLFATERTM